MSWKTELLKRWRYRLATALLFLAVFVLADEVAKEGYVFDWTDVFNGNLTHEKVFVVLLLLAILFGWRKKQ